MISCFTNSYGRFGADACIEQVRSAGLQHVELAIKTDGVPSIFGEAPILTDRSSGADVDRVQSLLDDNGVILSSCNITSGNPLEEDVLEITLRKLQLASQLGVTLVVAGAGEADSAEDIAKLLDQLRRIGDAAGGLGITYCFETHPGLSQNADRMLEVMSTLAHPQLRLNFDTGNILFYNEGANVLDELRKVREWVQHVHLKDHNGQVGDWHFPACGAAGAVDFAAVRGILEDIDYSGPCSLEIEGIKGEPPLDLEQHHQRVVDSVAELKRCGYTIA